MPRVIHFEIHAEDPERAIRFYEAVLGWSFTRWTEMEYWLVKTGPAEQPGIDGGLMRRHGTIDGTAVIAYVCTVDVPDLQATISAVEGAGGAIALPRMPVPGVGWLAYFKDTEGNVFGAMQSDPAAK
ncbi:VOC family protein [Acidobacteria bacterium ACD]|nr:MAG: VOC family protein [Acidobacteriota bacterium]MCE7957834.1 VOC family protein [Acidobacteria bacterium ACB2]MDL1948709.1 VOC family protein [Acidobacteria bacterium ACD]